MSIRPSHPPDDDDDVTKEDGAIIAFDDCIVFELNTAADRARVFNLLHRWAERESEDKEAAAVLGSINTVEDFHAEVLNQWPASG